MTGVDGGGDPRAVFQDAKSESWSVRAAAGRRLAADAQVPGAAEILHDLLLDFRDTFVTQETAQALLERGDVLGLRMVLAALAESAVPSGEGWDPSTMDELGSAVSCDPRWMTDTGWAQLSAQLRELASGADEVVAGEAQRLLVGVRPPAG